MIIAERMTLGWSSEALIAYRCCCHFIGPDYKIFAYQKFYFVFFSGVAVDVEWVTIRNSRYSYIRCRRVPLAEVYWSILENFHIV